MLPIAVSRGSVLLRRHCDAIRHVLPVFMDDIMFLYDGPYSGMNSATRDRFRLNVFLIYRKVRRTEFSFLLLKGIVMTNYLEVTCKLK